MQKIFFSLSFFCFLCVCFPQVQSTRPETNNQIIYNNGDNLFSQAEKIAALSNYNEELQEKAEYKYQQALSVFSIIPLKGPGRLNDSLSFQLRLKKAFIYYYFDSLSKAKEEYLSALEQCKMVVMEDSLLFMPKLFAGAIYYSYEQFDSALFWYKEAENIKDKYSIPLKGTERLYNRLGTLYYELGNYRQARNYIQKAISVADNADKNLLVNYKINLASLYLKMEEYSAARQLYESLLPSSAFRNEIYHNLAIIHIKSGEYQKAIHYLSGINYGDHKKNIDLYYNYTLAYYGLEKKDSVDFYLLRSLAENIKWNGQRNNIQHGLIIKFEGDRLTSEESFPQAVSKYQQAITEFNSEFKEPDPLENPETFSGVFSFINLFQALVAKASAFDAWYRAEKNQNHLKASLAAYQSAFMLASYVEKTYDSDEARLFLGRMKYTVHSKPIETGIELYQLTKEKKWLEQVYQFDQQNKASVLAFNVQENQLKGSKYHSSELSRSESFLKSAITRLSVKSSHTNSPGKLDSIKSELRDLEMELVKTQEKIKKDPFTRQAGSGRLIPDLKSLQESLDNSSALLSYHLSSTDLVILLVTPIKFDYFKLPINDNFFLALDELKSALRNINGRYKGAAASQQLYQKLINPVYAQLAQVKRLIIIPDDELTYLPFEALMDEKKHYLVEKFSIQYQYSTALLQRNKKSVYNPGTLSFAPFSDKNASDSSGLLFAGLPASGDEIKNLEGNQFKGANATKKNFLQSLNKNGIIHLATHASVSNIDPVLSFIAFYPGNNDFKLYAPEIADLNLDSTQLVILSACETGTGKLIKGEGLMSLSRAFAYAGCPDIITSLWKAEDKATAFITGRLHFYLDKKYSRDIALQKAKLDLLINDEIDPRFKIPSYWAHLIFIGTYEALPAHRSKSWWITLPLLILAIGYIIAKRKNLFD